MLPLNKNCYFLVKSNQQSIHHPSKLMFVNTTLFDLVNAATRVSSFNSILVVFELFSCKKGMHKSFLDCTYSDLASLY